MATPLPAATDFTGPSATEGTFKTKLTDMRTFLADLLGTDGTEATALAALQAAFSAANPQGGSYTLQSADRGKVVYYTGSGGVTLTLPVTSTTDFGVGYSCSVVNLSTGTITLTRSSTDTVDGATTVALGAGSSTILFIAAAAKWVTIGKGPGAATATTSGIVELATTAEAATGTDTARAVTPAGLQAAKQLSAHYGQATTNGTTVKEITGIPSWANRITLISSDLSGTYTSSSSAYIELGDAGGFETNTDKQFSLGAFGENSIHAELVRVPGTNTWVFKVLAWCSVIPSENSYCDTQTTSATTDRIRIRLANGNFDAGTLTAYYE